jgi:hypothetical protein
MFFPLLPHKSTTLHQIAALLRVCVARRVEGILFEVAVKGSRFQIQPTENK